MRITRLAVIAAVVSMCGAITMSGCGGSSSDEVNEANREGVEDALSEMTLPYVVGTWTGTFTGSDGSGSITVTVLSQAGQITVANIQGSIALNYSNGRVEGGALPSGSQVYDAVGGSKVMWLFLTYQSGGANLFQGTIDSTSTSVTGTYSGDVGSGTFQMTR